MKSICIFQIGSNVGNTPTPVFRTMTKDQACILIEPVPYLFAHLVLNYTTRMPLHDLRFYQIAVSDHDGTLTLHVPSEDNDYEDLPHWACQLASVNPAHIPAHLPQLKTEIVTVPCFRLNTICEQLKIGKIEYLCVDTEGHDYEILMDLDLTRIKPRHIIFEAKHMDGVFVKGARYTFLLAHFLKHGYKIVSEGVEDTHLALAPAGKGKPGSGIPLANP